MDVHVDVYPLRPGIAPDKSIISAEKNQVSLFLHENICFGTN